METLPQMMEVPDDNADSELVLLEHGDRRILFKRGSGSKAEKKAQATFADRIKRGWAAFMLKEPLNAEFTSIVTKKDAEIEKLKGELVAIRALPDRPARVTMVAPLVGG